MSATLALLGGAPAITIPRPHEIWPPAAQPDELEELSRQRNIDISIKGRSGPIKEFEELFQKFLNDEVRYIVSFNSGTSALLAGYFALGIGEGDEVIGPCLTFHAALSPLYLLRATPILVDIDVKTRCIDPDRIEAAITERTKAITVVHQWGHPADMDTILRIAHKYNLKVLEDCSHAHGSKYKGRLCGTFGDVAIFSLQANKAIFAGEGGILATNSALYHDRATLLGHYRDRSRDEVIDSELQKYWVTGFGLKLRLPPFNAIIAKHSLRRFPIIKEGRHKCLRYFIEKLAEVDYIEAPYIADTVDMGAWYGFKPLYKKERLGNLSRTELIRVLRAEGMEVGVPSGPLLATQPLYSEEKELMLPDRKNRRTSYAADYPAGLQVQAEALSLPTFYEWEQHKEIIDQYIRAFQKIGAQRESLLVACEDTGQRR
jgi:dTDP-4-amino-4,6-dideoxygalactose transaminase